LNGCSFYHKVNWNDIQLELLPGHSRFLIIYIVPLSFNNKVYEVRRRSSGCTYKQTRKKVRVGSLLSVQRSSQTHLLVYIFLSANLLAYLSQARGNICWRWLRMTATGKNAFQTALCFESTRCHRAAEGHCGSGGRGQCLQMAVFQQRHAPFPPPHPPQDRLRRVIPAVARAPSRAWLLSGATAPPFPHIAAASRQARVGSAGGQVGCWVRSQGGVVWVQELQQSAVLAGIICYTRLNTGWHEYMQSGEEKHIKTPVSLPKQCSQAKSNNHHQTARPQALTKRAG
jgi:hypothetical protein